MRGKNKRNLAIAVVVLLAMLVGCGPEAGRPRGAGFGTGADVGNHGGEPQRVQPHSKVFAAEGQP